MEEIRFEDYKKMIHNAAWKAHRETGIEYEEFYGIGQLIFVEALKTFNPSISTFSTHLYHNLKGIKNPFKRVENTQAFMPFYDEDGAIEGGQTVENFLMSNSAPVHHEYEFLETMVNLTTEAKEVVKIIFECPQEIISEAMHQPKRMIGNLTKILKGQGWRYQTDILPVFKEIKAALNN